jgi:hypothetical protein
VGIAILGFGRVREMRFSASVKNQNRIYEGHIAYASQKSKNPL